MEVLIEQKKLEAIQDVIDRFMYLPEDETQQYIDSLKNLHKQERYAIDCKIVDGVRQYRKL